MLRTFRLSYFRPSNHLTHINQTFTNAHGVAELFWLVLVFLSYKYQCCLEVFPVISFLSKVIGLSVYYFVYGYTLEWFPSFKTEFLVKTENISPWHERSKRNVNSFPQQIITKGSKWTELCCFLFLSLRNQVCFCFSGSSQVILGQGSGFHLEGKER